MFSEIYRNPVTIEQVKIETFDSNRRKFVIFEILNAVLRANEKTRGPQHQDLLHVHSTFT